MKLVHFTEQPLRRVRDRSGEQRVGYKPRGLWVSDEEAAESWTWWATAESFIDDLGEAYAVELSDNGNVLRIASVAELDAFHRQYRQCHEDAPSIRGIDWRNVASEYDGIIISPYQWARRYFGHGYDWYYGWDCASGCIWRPRAIAALRPKEVPA